MNLAIVIIIGCLVGMFLQDLKYRQVHILFLIVLFITSIYIVNTNYSLGQTFMVTLYNLGFFCITFLILIAYMSFKHKTFINPFKNYFGIGDLFFFVSISPLFFLHNYVLFFILSMIFSIVLYFVFKKVTSTSIPLAGYASLLLIFLIGKDLLLNYPAITLLK